MTKDMQLVGLWLICVSKLLISVNVSVNGCRSLCVSPPDRLATCPSFTLPLALWYLVYGLHL